MTLKTNATSHYLSLSVKHWLTILLGLVIIMIAVGGITRLTRSGLSMVEWRPVAGIIPPITDQDWAEQFELYKKTPEFQMVNSNFSVTDYKNIFMWEYLHRVLGRLIFLFALIPGIYFWRKSKFEGSKLILILSLIAGQGLIGWLMVKSGLNREPHVSPFMLALHFFSALIVMLVIFKYLCQFYSKFMINNKELELSEERKMTAVFRSLGILLVSQIFYGCLTSGWKAGFAFNTYPLMGEQFFPPGGLLQEPLWINFFTNPSTVQWTHRWLGILVLINVLFLGFQIWKNVIYFALKKPLIFLAGLILVQIILGILNLLFIIPISLAVLHQVVASVIVLGFYNFVFRFESTST